MNKTKTPSSLTTKIAVWAFVIACVAIGIVGLVLPIIPGLLLLAIAAVVLARRFPWLEARLRRHRAIGKHLDRSDAFLRLSVAAQVKVAALLCVKLLLDTLAVMTALASRLRRA
jgi:uncharacterized membrane protein YbaN (DUF454 family)